MKIGIVFNSRSGKGRAAGVVHDLTDILHADGHELTVADVAASRDASRIAADGADLLMIAGGDGSVHHALGAAHESGAALYHVPMGTENLFSRQFGMSRDFGRIRAALRQWTIAQIDLGRVDREGSTLDFALMLSIGMDASIIHRLTAERKGKISHLSYAKPILREVLRPSLKPVSVRVHGKTIVDRESGLLIIANSRQYAVRLDPATRASMQDGKLDVVFFPAETLLGAARWCAASWLRDHSEDPGVRYAQAETIEVEAGELPSQIDGEAWHAHTGGVVMHAVPRRLRVLLPGAAA